MKKITKSLFIITGLVFALSSCVKDEVVIEAGFNRPLNIAAPVFHAHFSAQDVIDRIGKNDYIFVDGDGLIVAQIADTSFDVTYDEIIRINDINYLVTHPLSTGKSVNAVQEFRDTIGADLKEDQRLDSTRLQSGMLEVTVTPPGGFTGTWDLLFPDITLPGGDKLTVSGTLDAPSTTQTDIAGADIRFFQVAGGGSSFEMISTVNGSVSGTPAETGFTVTLKLTDAVPEYLFGYLGTDTIMKQEDNVDIVFFDNNEYLDIIEFKDIKMFMVSENSFGAPVAISLDTVLFRNTDTGEEQYLQIPDDNTITQSAAVFDPGTGTAIPSKDSLLLNKDNSNLVDIVNITPDKLHYSIAEVVNYDGDTGESNFLINDGTASLKGRIKIQVPLWFKTDKYERTDTVDFDVRDIVDDSTSIDYLEELNLYFDFENGFPFSIFTQGYMTDDNLQVIDSLFSGEQQIWKSPPIDAEGVTQGSEPTEVNIRLDHDKVKKLYDNRVTKILLRSRMNTGDAANPEFVKLYARYTIDIKMSFDLKSSDKPL